MPCGCLGGAGRLSPASALRAGLFAAAAGWAALAGGGAPAPGLVLAALVAALVAVRLLGRRPPGGALEIASEGPPLGDPTGLADWLPAPDGRMRLAVFTSARCRLCRELGPALERLVAGGAVVLRTYEEEREREVWAAVDVPGAPFAVAVGADGTVLAKGTVNSERQLLSVAIAAHERAGVAVPSALRDPGPAVAQDSRRGFLARTAAAAGALAVAPTVASLVRPGEAEAYHFCGHIFTTDSCPHPTGLPRIDVRGGALRARDGRPVDDLGRLVDGEGFAIDEAGRRLTDPDGRPLPPAPRTAVCTQVARRYRIRTQVDGAWYRCCGGQVRKLVDCCTPSDRRINGDRALRGYCHEGRKVFCVLYYETRVPC